MAANTATVNPTTTSAAGWVCLLLLGLLIQQGESRCTFGDMRFREGRRFSLFPACGMCECGPGGRWACPENADCEQQPLVLTCAYRGRELRAGDVVADGCTNCTCLVGGRVTCTNSTSCSPGGGGAPSPPPIRNPAPTCEYRGRQRAVGEVFPAGGRHCHICECKDSGIVDCTDTCPRCHYNDTLLQEGDVVPALDGCNTCECMAEGQISCSENFCHSVRCTYEGREYHIGDEFQKSGDPCNKCDCGIDGQVVCGSNQRCPARAPGPAGASPDEVCVYKGQAYLVGAEWPWAAGTGSQCDRCRCLLEPSSRARWVCSSGCPDPPTSLWSRLRMMLYSIFYRLPDSRR